MHAKLLVSLFFIAALYPNHIRAQLLTDNSSFGGDTVVESFEGIASISQRVATVFDLPTGITITEPNPNRFDSSALFIVNGGFFGLGPASPIIPDGTAYLGQANVGTIDDRIVLVLPELSQRVGAFFATATNVTSDSLLVNIEFYDDNDDLIGATSTSSVLGTEGDGWRQNFIGWESADGIRSVRLDGNGGGVLRVDALQFQPLSVPEPGASIVLVIGLTAVALRRSR